jgi:hypothetical protein
MGMYTCSAKGQPTYLIGPALQWGTMHSLFLFGIFLEKGPQTHGQLDACIIIRWWDF